MLQATSSSFVSKVKLVKGEVVSPELRLPEAQVRSTVEEYFPRASSNPAAMKFLLTGHGGVRLLRSLWRQKRESRQRESRQTLVALLARLSPNNSGAAKALIRIAFSGHADEKASEHRPILEMVGQLPRMRNLELAVKEDALRALTRL